MTRNFHFFSSYNFICVLIEILYVRKSFWNNICPNKKYPYIYSSNASLYSPNIPTILNGSSKIFLCFNSNLGEYLTVLYHCI